MDNSAVFSPPPHLQSKPVRPRKSVESCERTPGNRITSTKLAPHSPIEIDVIENPIIKLKDLTMTNSTRASTKSVISDGVMTRKANVMKTRPQSEVEIASNGTRRIQFPKSVLARENLEFNLAEENQCDFSRRKEELLSRVASIHDPENISSLIEEKLHTNAPEELKKLISWIFEVNYFLSTKHHVLIN